MNLEYSNYLTSNDKRKIKELYTKSFPKEERFPFWILRHCSKEENVEFNSIMNKQELIGIEYILKLKSTAYLMYFAVNEDKRNLGYGTKIIKDLNKKNDNVILSIERVSNKDNNDKLRRKKFYLKNGFYETNTFYEDAGVQYELLYTNKNFTITKEDLENIYKQMTKSKLMMYIIGKIFNIYNINFIK